MSELTVSRSFLQSVSSVVSSPKPEEALPMIRARCSNVRLPARSPPSPSSRCSPDSHASPQPSPSTTPTCSSRHPVIQHVSPCTSPRLPPNPQASPRPSTTPPRSPRCSVLSPNPQTSPRPTPSQSSKASPAPSQATSKGDHVVSSNGILCAVCGDRATGRYFGAHICEACKSFFIRSTKKGEPNFRCVNNQDCSITPYSRLLCQYCRYQNCMKAGMGRKAKQPSKDLAQDQIPCRVCGDVSSGIHFGVYTCEGCKGFFRRSMRDGNTYNCSGKGECVITPVTRNLCRYCRFKKCLSEGMSRACIKLGRHQKYDTRPLEIARPPGESASLQSVQIKQEAASPSSERPELSQQKNPKEQNDSREAVKGGRTAQPKETRIDSTLIQESNSQSNHGVGQGKLKLQSYQDDAASSSSQKSHPGVLNISEDLHPQQRPASPDVGVKVPTSSVSPRASVSRYLPVTQSSLSGDISEKPVDLDISKRMPSVAASSAVHYSVSKAPPMKNHSLACPPPEVQEISSSTYTLKRVKDEFFDEVQQCRGHTGEAEGIHPECQEVQVNDLSSDTPRAESPDDSDTDLEMFLLRAKENAFPMQPKAADGVVDVIDAIPSSSSSSSSSSVQCFRPMSVGATPTRVISPSPSFEESRMPVHSQNHHYSTTALQQKSAICNWYPSPISHKSEPNSPCSASDTGYFPGLGTPISSPGVVDRITEFPSTSSFLTDSRLQSENPESSLGETASQDNAADQPHSNFTNLTEATSERALMLKDNLYSCAISGSLSPNMTREVALLCHSFLQRLKGGLMSDRIFCRASELALMNLLRPISALERESTLFEVTRSMTGFSAIMRSLQTNVELSEAADFLCHNPECKQGPHWEKFHETVSYKIIASVQYIKKIPGIDAVAMEDRLKLIKQSAFPLILIYKAWKMGTEWEWMEKTFFTNRTLRRMSVGWKNEATSFVNLFNLLQLDSIEISLLMVLVVLNPDTESLRDQHAVLKLHREYRTILQNYCQETHGNLENYLVLLQFVPMLRIIDSHHKRCIRQNTLPDVTMPALFAEINLST